MNLFRQFSTRAFFPPPFLASSLDGMTIRQRPSGQRDGQGWQHCFSLFSTKIPDEAPKYSVEWRRSINPSPYSESEKNLVSKMCDSMKLSTQIEACMIEWRGVLTLPSHVKHSSSCLQLLLHFFPINIRFAALVLTSPSVGARSVLRSVRTVLPFF